jgi:hypothetical protein
VKKTAEGVRHPRVCIAAMSWSVKKTAEDGGRSLTSPTEFVLLPGAGA